MRIPTLSSDFMQKGFTVWLTGLSGSGKTTADRLLHSRLQDAGLKVEVLDGDEVRSHLCRELGFSKEDRIENVRRIAALSKILTRNGIAVIVAAISPYRVSRDDARRQLSRFIEAYMQCTLKVLVSRDSKGLYRRALAAELPNFTGVSDPYEPPLYPEVTIDSASERHHKASRKSAAYSKA